MENKFELFLSEYEIDPDGSLADVLFEFYAEGYIAACDDYGVDYDEEEDYEEASEGS